MKKTKLNDKNIIFIFIIWRLFLFILDFISIRILSFKPSFPYHEDVLSKLSIPFFWQWANFDGVHYIMIAQHGYKSIFSGITQAFFPLFPLTIRYFDYLINNLLFSGLILSNLFFLLSLLVFKRLLDKLKVDPLYPLLFILFFPTSYYFGAVYTESLFLLLSVGAFLCIENKKWFLSSILIGLSSATRITGLFLLVPFTLKYISFYKLNNNDEKKDKKAIFRLAWLTVICISGLLAYCLYLLKEFNDPFYFATVQSKFGASRQTDRIILLYQVIWRYIKMFLTVERTSLLFYTISQEFIISMLFLGLLIVGYYKSIDKSYLHYSLLSFILPTLTGNLSSMPRYVLVLFPAFLVLNKIIKKRWKNIVIIVFLIILVINSMLFLRGYWIA